MSPGAEVFRLPDNMPVHPATGDATHRRLLKVSLGLAAVGVAISAQLIAVHQDAAVGVASFCSINDTFDCGKVALSSWSVLAGVPIAAWGVLGYGIVALLAGSGLRASPYHSRWPAGLLLLLGGFASLTSVVLAIVSKVVLGTWCLLCMGSWVTAAGLLAAGVIASKSAGPGQALAADLQAMRRRPRTTALSVVAVLLGAAALVAGYRRTSLLPTASARTHAPAPGAGGAVPLPPATQPAVLFSDYTCPFCTRAHAELRSVLGSRPDLQVVRRHFPLDSECNPLLERPKHPGACGLARAAICAEAQGRLEEMEDALFGAQESPASVDALALARRVGVNLEQFAACLEAPSTAARLASDIAEGARAKLRSTPSYLVDGVLYEGWHFPLERYPAPSSTRGH